MSAFVADVELPASFVSKERRGGGGRLVVAGSVVGQWGPGASPARSRGSRAGRKTREKKEKVSPEKEEQTDTKIISVKQVLVKKEPVLTEE